jgi:hypothetical protein
VSNGQHSSAASIFSDLFRSNDGVTLAAQSAISIIGRELSPQALQVAAFLRYYGCEDIIAEVLNLKRYQGSTRDYNELVRVQSKQSAWEEMTEFQGKVDKRTQKAAG